MRAWAAVTGGLLEALPAALPPRPFSIVLNERARALGDDPCSIADRIRGDIAIARSQFDTPGFVIWT